VSALDRSGISDAIFEAAYEELRARARQVVSRYDVPTLSPTALVHEAYLRLANKPDLQVHSREHLLNLIALAIRYVIFDALRHKMRLGGAGGAVHVQLDHPSAGAAAAASNPQEVMALLLSFEALCEKWPEAMRVFELRRFGGLSVAETAELIGCSTKTVERRMRLATALLTRVLEGKPPDEANSNQ